MGRYREWDDYSGYSERRIPRRSLLKGAAKLAVGAGVIATGFDSAYSHVSNRYGLDTGLTQPIWEQLESGADFRSPKGLAKELERKFPILTLSAKEFENMSGSADSGPKKVIDWDAPRLKGLEEVLESLPENFYSPREVSGKLLPLAFVLSDDPQEKEWNPEDWAGLYEPNLKDRWGIQDTGYAGVVFYKKKDVGQTFLEQAESDLLMVHELAHHATWRNISDLRSRLTDPMSLSGVESLQVKFKNPILYRSDEYAKLSRTERKIVYGGSNFYEFFAVCSEFYYQGKKDFLKAYTPHLGPEHTENLYEGIKSEVFKGREY